MVMRQTLLTPYERPYTVRRVDENGFERTWGKQEEGRKEIDMKSKEMSGEQFK